MLSPQKQRELETGSTLGLQLQIDRKAEEKRGGGGESLIIDCEKNLRELSHSQSLHSSVPNSPLKGHMISS